MACKGMAKSDEKTDPGLLVIGWISVGLLIVPAFFGCPVFLPIVPLVIWAMC